MSDPKFLMQRLSLLLALTVVAFILNACATLPGREPLAVTVAGIEPLAGQGMEVRMRVKLRVQNPNEAAIEYDGVSLKLEVEGDTYASGVSDARGTIPRFGEAVLEVPVTMSTMRAAMQAYALMRDGKPPAKLRYKMKGKLSSAGFGSTSFTTAGEFDLSGLPTETRALLAP
jgi:LEA14-like dessication related protein